MEHVTAGQSADSAFGDLYHRTSAKIGRVIAAGVRREHRDLVEDLVQETYLAYWIYEGEHEVRSPAGLLVTIARHIVAAHYRRPESTALVPWDFTVELGARRLPATASAEDIALERLARWIEDDDQAAADVEPEEAQTTGVEGMLADVDRAIATLLQPQPRRLLGDYLPTEVAA